MTLPDRATPSLYSTNFSGYLVNRPSAPRSASITSRTRLQDNFRVADLPGVIACLPIVREHFFSAGTSPWSLVALTFYWRRCIFT
jgi:hypothetical protein